MEEEIKKDPVVPLGLFLFLLFNTTTQNQGALL